VFPYVAAAATSAGNQQLVATGWDILFLDTSKSADGTVACPVTSCEAVWPAGTVDSAKHVTVAATAPYKMTASNNVLLGYTAVFQLRCSNGVQTVTSKSITVQ